MTLTRVIGSPSLQHRPDRVSPQLAEVSSIRCNLQAGQKITSQIKKLRTSRLFGGCAFQLLSAVLLLLTQREETTKWLVTIGFTLS